MQAISSKQAFRAFVRTLYRQNWVVYSKPPFGGPEHVLHYLARYTHRVAISNHRLLNVADGKVTFRWKDYAHGNKHRKMTRTADEFLRRFLLHVLPKGFIRIRFFGFLAARRRGTFLPLCFRLLAGHPQNAFTYSLLPTADAGDVALPTLRRSDEGNREAYGPADPVAIGWLEELR